MGVGATLDPRPGGVFSLNKMARYLVEGEYVAVEPYSRVVFTWGYGFLPDEQNPLPPGSSTVEVELVPDGNATIVRLTHRVPVELVDFHVMGWENYLGRLAHVAGGGASWLPAYELTLEPVQSFRSRASLQASGPRRSPARPWPG